MEQDAVTLETATPGRGTPESAAWFREQLEALGVGNSALARAMIENGDDRRFDTIVRGLRRMATGEARVSGEMRASLTMMRSKPAGSRPGRAPKPFEFTLTPQEIAVLQAPAGDGGQQGYHKRLMEQLAESPTIRLSDEELGELIRCMSRYGSGGFQGRLQKAFLRLIARQIGAAPVLHGIPA
jgi:hypothetical protein